MLIQINRKIFKYLPEDLRQIYVYEIVQNENNSILNYEDEAKITNTIISVINDNENWHEKYGIIRANGCRQVAEDCLVPASNEPTGFYQLGKFLIAPSDWSWDDNGDFDYSFDLFYSLEYCSERS